MIFVEVCVGSSCHIKGAPEIVELMQKYIADAKLEDEIVLSGSFCSVTVGDDVYTGITPDGFRDFWNDRILPAVEKAKEG